MNISRRLGLVAAFLVATAPAMTGDGLRRQELPSKSEEHTAWISLSLKKMETIKAGMTRKDLLTIFTVEGGISTRIWHRYVFRECPYIKVDVEFSPALATKSDPKVFNDPNDTITKISKPFLEWSILD